MKPIQKDELYENLGEFLKGKGIELKEGAYTKGIHAGCSLLADAINLSQTGFERAKAGLDKKLEQVRQVIHDKTAPKSASNSRPAGSGSSRGGNASAKSAGKKRATNAKKFGAKTSKDKAR